VEVAYILLDAGAKANKCRDYGFQYDRCQHCHMHAKRLLRAMEGKRAAPSNKSKETFEAVLRDEFGDEPGNTSFLKELELAKRELGQANLFGENLAPSSTDRAEVVSTVGQLTHAT
jgi:protein-disulfide isomerase